MVGIIKRALLWVFLTVSWGLIPGFFVYYVLGLAHHPRATRLAWGLAVLVILGGGAALGTLRVMAQPARRPKSTARVTVAGAITAAIMIDVLIVLVGGVSLWFALNWHDLD